MLLSDDLKNAKFEIMDCEYNKGFNTGIDVGIRIAKQLEQQQKGLIEMVKHDFGRNQKLEREKKELIDNLIIKRIKLECNPKIDCNICTYMKDCITGKDIKYLEKILNKTWEEIIKDK